MNNEAMKQNHYLVYLALFQDDTSHPNSNPNPNPNLHAT